MIELEESGIYVFESPDTIKKLYSEWLGKGVYIVRIEASYDDAVVTDMIEFHIDPPGGSMNYYPFIMLAIVSGIIMLVLQRTKNATIFRDQFSL